MAPTFVKRSLLLTALSPFTPQIVADITTYNNLTAGSGSSPQFHVYNDSFLTLLGENPTLSLILNSANTSFPQFHEAAILASSSPPVLFVTSNQYNFSGIDSPNTDQKAVVISRISQDTTTQQWSSEIINPTGSIIHLANGGTYYKNGTLVFCAQGDLISPGGFLTLSSSPPYTASNLLNSYLGTTFNSPNDVTFTKDGAMWFTDPQFGFIQNIRPAPELPAQVYRCVPDVLEAPNGIGFSPDEKKAYITDTAKNNTFPTVSKTIYAYDAVTSGSGPILANRRTFAMPAVGTPDGIKTDAAGNVYAGCGDGVNIWNSQGVLLGKIVVSGGSSNFALGGNGEVFLLNETKLWLVMLSGVARNSTTGRMRI